MPNISSSNICLLGYLVTAQVTTSSFPTANVKASIVLQKSLFSRNRSVYSVCNAAFTLFFANCSAPVLL